MLEFVPFRTADLAKLSLQPEQEDLQPLIADPAYAAMLARSRHAWTAVIDGEARGCGGLLEQWPGRAVAWALLCPLPRPLWVSFVGNVRRVFAAAERDGIWRIETGVRCGFAAGERLARAVGMEAEGIMRAYGPDRSDHWLFSKVRPW